MIRSLAAAAVFALPIASAQVLMMPPGPVTPGPAFVVSVFNDLPSGIAYLDGSFAMLHPSGELVHPEATVNNDVPITISPGQTLGAWFSVPTNAGVAPGSYLFIFPHPTFAGAAARLDVVTADPQFPAIHSFPPFAHSGYGSHVLDPITPFTDHWSIANTSNATHTFGAGEAIRIFSPGGATPIATIPLTGTTVPAGKIVTVNLPLSALGADVYTIEMAWTDPAVGPLVRRTGVRPATSWNADLALPQGKVVPSGGSLPVRFLAIGPPAFPVYLLLASVQPGTLPLPGGVDLPLAYDPVFAASASSGLFGLLQNHAGVMGFGPPPCACPALPFKADGLAVVHPNLPIASGVTLRIAGVAFEPTSGAWLATQGEEIRFE